MRWREFQRSRKNIHTWMIWFDFVKNDHLLWKNEKANGKTKQKTSKTFCSSSKYVSDYELLKRESMPVVVCLSVCLFFFRHLFLPYHIVNALEHISCRTPLFINESKIVLLFSMNVNISVICLYVAYQNVPEILWLCSIDRFQNIFAKEEEKNNNIRLLLYGWLK